MNGKPAYDIRYSCDKPWKDRFTPEIIEAMKAAARWNIEYAGDDTECIDEEIDTFANAVNIRARAMRRVYDQILNGDGR